jgi:hypothetical protein
MYVIALIQNQSEMIRYSYADARPLLNFENYHFDLYTAENISKLGDALNHGVYDAILIGSNALNDQEIRDGLLKQKEQISKYLEQPKGLVILHQMKMTTVSSYGFLPSQYDVAAIDRKRDNPRERAVEGELSIDPANKDHVVLLYPNVVKINIICKRCLETPGVEGLYWHYLKPLDDRMWVSLIRDSTYKQKRDLLFVSRADLPPRIVLSSLTLDWHRQTELFENILRYVTEGRPDTAIIVRKGRKSFPFDYLVANLQVRKVPHSIYSQESVRLLEIPLNVHRIIILDPAWSIRDIQNSDFQKVSRYFDKGSKLICFDRTDINKPSMVCVGGESEFERVKKNAIVWIISKFQGGLWDGSFWSTVDTLKVLKEFGEPLGQYKEEVLNYVRKHDIDGSYDEVFGASCALLWIYYTFLGPESLEFKKTLEWINNKIEKCALYEKALAYETLREVDIPVDNSTINTFYEQAIKKAQRAIDELECLRYARTLLSYGRVKEAQEIAIKLKLLQRNGKWIDVSTTSVILSLLIRLRQKMEKPSEEIDDMIFRGMIYIREQLTSSTFWGNKVSDTAKALAAWRDFESLISGFPIEEVVSSIQATEAVQKNTVAIDSALNLIKSLRDELSETKKVLSRITQRENMLAKLAVSGILLSTISIVFFLLLLGYVVNKGLFYDAFGTIQEWVGLRGIIATIVTLLIFVLLLILNKYGLLPKRVRSFIKAIASILRIPFPDEEKDREQNPR